MIALVEEKRRELAGLCERFKVERLDLFGSAASGRFQAETSDLDFLVRFADREPTGDCADRYLDFAEAIERLFQRPVDLVTEQSVRNPYFRRVVEASREPVYERSDTQAAPSSGTGIVRESSEGVVLAVEQSHLRFRHWGKGP